MPDGGLALRTQTRPAQNPPRGARLLVGQTWALGDRAAVPRPPGGARGCDGSLPPRPGSPVGCGDGSQDEGPGGQGEGRGREGHPHRFARLAWHTGHPASLSLTSLPKQSHRNTDVGLGLLSATCAQLRRRAVKRHRLAIGSGTQVYRCSLCWLCGPTRHLHGADTRDRRTRSHGQGEGGFNTLYILYGKLTTTPRFSLRSHHLQNPNTGRSHRGSVETNQTSVHEVTGSIPGLAQWVQDPVLLWLWGRPAAVALIPPPSLGTSMCRRCSPKNTKQTNTG